MTEITPSLSELESKAHDHIDVATDNWLLAIETINNIKNSGLWKAKAKTWAAYYEMEFKAKLNYSYGRLRQYMAALPLAQYIEAETGITLNESQIRDMRKKGYGQSIETLEIVRRAKSAADEVGQVLQPKHFKAVEETFQERDATNSNISYDEQTVSTNKPLDPVQIAIVQKVHEANERQSEYRKSNNDTPPIEGRVGHLDLDLIENHKIAPGTPVKIYIVKSKANAA